MALIKDTQATVKDEVNAVLKSVKDDFTATTDFICTEKSSIYHCGRRHFLTFDK